MNLRIRQFAFVLLDVLCIYGCLDFAVSLQFEFMVRPEYVGHLRHLYIPVIIGGIFFLFVLNLYQSLWRYASVNELINVYVASTLIGVLAFIVSRFIHHMFPISVFLIFTLVLAFTLTVTRFFYRFIRHFKKDYHGPKQRRQLERVMIVGAGDAGEKIQREIARSEFVYKEVVCFIDDDKTKWHKSLHEVPIVGGKKSIVDACKKYKVDEIIVAMPTAKREKMIEILNICKETKCKLKKLPGIYQLINGEINVSELKEVEIQDLLGREQIQVNLADIMGYVKNKVVMVTGGGGSIGSELCRQIAQAGCKQLIIVDIYENNAYDIQLELKRKYPDLDLQVMIASVRNTDKVNALFEKYHPEIVYHAAAHKHVPLMEDSPNEAVKNNVFGTLNCVRAADHYGTKRFILISTDKAVNPTNIMGATKRICEMIIQSYNKKSKTEYVAVRFGNVLGSNGSVIPLFKKQIKEGGPVTVTHPDIIRYFMTIPEAVSLVLQAGAYAKGGEIFILDMGEPVKIADMARNLIKLSGYEPDVDIQIKYTGLRPGEKLYEELLMKEEGMQDTPNHLIHIGKPIEMDDEKFYQDLKELKLAAYRETDDMKQRVSKIVPTYNYKKGEH